MDIKYLYQKPDTDKFDDLDAYAYAEAMIYNGKHPPRPDPHKFKVARMTPKCIFVSRHDEGETYRIDRAKLERGEGVYHKRFLGHLYIWDAIKADVLKFQTEWDEWLAITQSRIKEEYKANDFQCAKCGSRCEALTTPPFQNDSQLSKIGWGHTKTPYDNQWTCKTCRTDIFNEYAH